MGTRIMSLDIIDESHPWTSWTSSSMFKCFSAVFPQEQYKTMDTNRLTLLYFSISGLDLLGHLDEIDREATIRYIYSFQSQFDEHGGFYGYPKAWKQTTKKTETARLYEIVFFVACRLLCYFIWWRANIVSWCIQSALAAVCVCINLKIHSV